MMDPVLIIVVCIFALSTFIVISMVPNSIWSLLAKAILLVSALYVAFWSGFLLLAVSL